MVEKRDYAIRRYLSKVGKLTYSSAGYASRYYEIPYGGYTITVRLSDHLKTKISGYKYNIEIINIGNSNYIVHLTSIGSTYSVSGTNILKYIKSILLLYPEIEMAMKKFVNAAHKYSSLLDKNNIKLGKALSTIQKNKEYSNMVDEIYEENKSLKKKAYRMKNLEEQVKQLKSHNCNLKNKIKLLLDNSPKV